MDASVDYAVRKFVFDSVREAGCIPLPGWRYVQRLDAAEYHMVCFEMRIQTHCEAYVLLTALLIYNDKTAKVDVVETWQENQLGQFSSMWISSTGKSVYYRGVTENPTRRSDSRDWVLSQVRLADLQIRVKSGYSGVWRECWTQEGDNYKHFLNAIRRA